MAIKPIPSVAPDISERLLPKEKDDLLRSTYLALSPSSDDAAVEAELHARHYWFRYRYMPWFMSVMNLDGANVLEIGAGVGASTIAFAERGARVEALDLNEASLQITNKRAELHDLSHLVHTTVGDATDIGTLYSGKQFDLIVYFASVEHMTHDERISTLSSAWQMLQKNAYLSVCDAPNRLWFYDEHTAFENFYHWISDDMAIAYAPRTSRGDFQTAFTSNPYLANLDPQTRLARWGRGVSYHDFEVALEQSAETLDIRGEWEYNRSINPEWAKAWYQTLQGRYQLILREISPYMPIAFLEPEIALMIRK